ncbi:hypothetical protein [Streptomyces sp. NPDC054975]
MEVPTPEQDPFTEAAGQALETAVTAVRLVLAIADAVRRHQQRQKGLEERLPPSEPSVSEASGELKQSFPLDIATALTAGADWPRMAQELVALRRAGVDLGEFLPRVSEIAATIREAAAANAERVAREGTGEWEKLLRETLPAGPVREAILSSPGWPEIAATMARLDARGVDVRQILASAHDEGLGVDQAMAKVLAGGSTPTTTRDAMESYGPLTIGLNTPSNLDLSDRERALRQLAISTQENERFARLVREAMPGREREADLMVTAKQWPLVAAWMARMETDGQATAHLTRVMSDASWQEGPPSQLGARLAEAAVDALRRPLGVARATVNATAARSRSSTVLPRKVQATTMQSPSVAAVTRHREPAPRSSKVR